MSPHRDSRPDRYLLDTCAFLWITAGDEAVPSGVRALLDDPSTEILVSTVSAWEIVVKHRLGKLPLPDRPDRFVADQRAAHELSSLPLTEAHALTLGKLPDLHRDPFDRMLICQAIAEGIPILTPDALISQYPVRVQW